MTIKWRETYLTTSKNRFFPQPTSVAASATADFNFFVPDDFASLTSIELIGIIGSGVDGSGKDIDLSSNYGTIDEPYDIHSESDTTTTYDYTGKLNDLIGINLAGVLTSLGAGDIAEINVTHNAIGGSIEYIGIKLTYEIS